MDGDSCWGNFICWTPPAILENSPRACSQHNDFAKSAGGVDSPARLATLPRTNIFMISLRCSVGWEQSDTCP